MSSHSTSNPFPSPPPQHVIADGWTYYEILNMLGDQVETGVPITPLQFTRKMEYEGKDGMEEKLIGKRAHKYMSSGAFIKAMIVSCTDV